MRTIVALLVTTATLSAQIGDYRSITPPTLKLKPGIRVEVSGDTYGGPGHVRIANKRTEYRSLFGEHRPKDLFAPPRDPTQALERCTWLHWGALVPDRSTFDAICALYAKHGYELKPLDEKAVFQESVRHDVAKLRFDRVEKRTDKGFEVAFTAWVMPPGMGAQARLSRFRYTLDRSGKVTSTKTIEYLRGPVLNWQTASLDFGEETTAEQKKAREEFAKRDQTRRDNRDRLIKAIYALKGVRKLPLGR